MKRISLFCAIILIAVGLTNAQSTMIIGDEADVTTSTTGGIMLIGGGSDNDNGFQWMINKSGGGDFVVLRSFGTDAYNEYIYGLGTVNSVETIIIDSRTMANDAAVAQKIRDAEAVFISGGDQWEYVDLWKGTLVEDALNYLINTKQVPIGGTSAGCAIQGRVYFDAMNGTVRSDEALADPYHTNLTLQRDNFLENSILANTITDTHYNNPDRRGRHTTFLARMVQDWGIQAKGIGVNEATAVCIDENGIAKVYGDSNYEDYAYFLQQYGGSPETCTSGTALTWNNSGQAVRVYKIRGDETASNSFDLNDWQTGTGGEWVYFYAIDAELSKTLIINYH